jgi:glucans biosynthesis protein
METHRRCLTHRRLCAGALLLILPALPSAAADRVEINLDYVAERAASLASKPFDDDRGRVPDYLRQLDYDAYKDIRFNPLRALWSEENLPFRIEFFHPGHVYDRAVRIHEFTAMHEQEIRFSTDFFDYGKQTAIRRRVPASLGYAGFRVLYPINNADRFDEFAVFAGSSYFRVMARGQAYGLSARCLALNTTVRQPEEFPLFRQFWLGKPEAGADHLRLYALIDSPSVAAAYEFILRPGEETVVNVRSRLFFRSIPLQIGLAPLSSMFFYGENTLRKPPDYRQEVHDSDGLRIFSATNRCTWYPLDNPAVTWPARVFSFDHPVRFALMQRDRDFEHYQDIGAAYHLRPGAIVEPGSWGPGRVVLYTFAARSEMTENITAFWQPASPPVVGVPYVADYTLRFVSAEPPPPGMVVATRTGMALNKPGFYECVVDFGGKQLAGLKDVDPVKAVVTGGAAVPIAHTSLQKNNFNGTWRLIVLFQSSAVSKDSVFRAHLELDDAVLTETWEYEWHAPKN